MLNRLPIPWRERYLTFGAPAIGEEEIAAVGECMRSGWLGTGPRVLRFEEALANYFGAPYAIAVNSCTAALHLALRDLRLPPRSEIITSTMTFCSTVNAILHSGHLPVLVDCDISTMNICVEDLARAITPRTKAVIPVHFGGRPCDMEAILSITKPRGIAIVEDCAHAIEGTIESRHCGTFGEFGCFSFYVTKNLTSVEGGMVICRDQDRCERIRMAALHGMDKKAWQRFSDNGYRHYAVADSGFKYNMTDLAASIALVQFGKLAAHYECRMALWRFYSQRLNRLPLILPPEAKAGTRHAMHLFTCLVDSSRTNVTRDEVLKGLHDLRIGAGVHYLPVHLHPYYQGRVRIAGGLSNAEWVGERTFSIPFSGALSDEDAEDVVRALEILLG